jgi:tRNA-modifying protein YgfZ
MTAFEVVRDVVMVEGPDAGTYLQSQLSQEVRDLSVGQSRWTLLLQPTGRVDVLARVLRSGDHAFVFDVDAGYGEVLVARLHRFKIRVKAEVSTIAWRCLSGAGSTLAPVSGAVAVVGWWGAGADLIGPNPSSAAGPSVVDDAALLMARVRAGWPAMGREITPGETIPGELPVLPVAVSFTKGCYPGQELVERMDSRAATAPRLLRRLVLAHDAGDVSGVPVRLDGADVGTVTSSAGGLALGLVRRTVGAGASVMIASPGGDVGAAVEVIAAP